MTSISLDQRIARRNRLQEVLVMTIPVLKNLIYDAIKNNKHNVVPIWGEMGLGKSTLGLWLLFDVFRDWDKVIEYCVFTFREFREMMMNAVLGEYRIPAVLWDDIAVYFHRSAIQYMHPEVKDFFSKYNFIRPYLANVFITTPNIEFIPRQLLDFATADLWVTRRGIADFDRSKLVRKFKGEKRTWRKQYDGKSVTWKEIPEDIYAIYAKMRHDHAVEAFTNPESVFIYTMPEPDEEPVDQSGSLMGLRPKE